MVAWYQDTRCASAFERFHYQPGQPKELPLPTMASILSSSLVPVRSSLQVSPSSRRLKSSATSKSDSKPATRVKHALFSPE